MILNIYESLICGASAQFNSTVLPFLVNYDAARSIVISDGSSMIACNNIEPPFPDFPKYELSSFSNNQQAGCCLVPALQCTRKEWGQASFVC